MIINMVGGGGGAGLNFDVKRYSTEAELLAATPKENTIGIISTTEMTGWIIDANQTEELTEGMVWILVGNESAVEFNALRKNGLQVYPLGAKQMVDGTLVYVTAMIYQNGEWVQWWNGELFDNGDQWESVTGGWTSNGYTRSDSLPVLSGSIGTDGTITLNGSNSGVVMMGTDEPIDLRGFSSITAYCKDLKPLNSSSMYLAITKSKTKYNSNFAASADFGSNKTSVDIPIGTSLQGEYYILVGTGNSAQQGGKITKVILNK